MGDVARYHGGALQGKQAQKVLDCNRDGSFEVLDCIKDLEELHSKYSTALSCLADVSDALRYSGDDFDDEGVQKLKEFCEEWGKIWAVLIPNRNIGHILAFVLQKVVEQH